MRRGLMRRGLKRVGLIVYGLDRPLMGIGRYTLELARALVALDSRPEVVLLTAGSPGPLASDVRFQVAPLPGCRLLPGLMTLGNLWLPIVARRLALEVVHDPTGITPFLFGAAQAQMVVTVHDVFPWSCPGMSTRLDTMIYRYWLPNVLSPGRQTIITDSEQSRRDLQRYLHITPERLQVVPLGIAPHFIPASKEVVDQVRRHFGLVGRYLLFVGAFNPRKNLARCLQAFARLRDTFPEAQFVLAGPRASPSGSLGLLIQQLDIAERLVFTGPVAEADLPALYAGAEALIFPSLCEGFGLPPLEAMACGTPVITSPLASLPEVAGDAALMVDPYSVEAIAEAMQGILQDQALAANLRARGLSRAAQFTWEYTARTTLEVYRAALGTPASRGMR